MGEMINNPKYRTGNHEKIIAWQMADQLDELVQEILRLVPRTEFKLKSQLDSASDSVGSNIVEGYYSGSTGEFIRFLKYSRRSCAEVQERLRRLQRKLLVKKDLCEKSISHSIKTGYILDRLIQGLEIKREKERLK